MVVIKGIVIQDEKNKGKIFLLTLCHTRAISFVYISSTWLRNLTKLFGQKLLDFGQPKLIKYSACPRDKWMRKFLSYSVVM